MDGLPAVALVFWSSRDCFSIRDICSYPDSVECVRTGVLDEEWHSAIRKRIAAMAREKIEYTPEQEEEEANPDYEEWMIVIGTAVENLTKKLRET